MDLAKPFKPSGRITYTTAWNCCKGQPTLDHIPNRQPSESLSTWVKKAVLLGVVGIVSTIQRPTEVIITWLFTTCVGLECK